MCTRRAKRHLPELRTTSEEGSTKRISKSQQLEISIVVLSSASQEHGAPMRAGIVAVVADADTAAVVAVAVAVAACSCCVSLLWLLHTTLPTTVAPAVVNPGLYTRCITTS